MPIRITGLNSGLDTEAIISERFQRIVPRKKNIRKHRQNCHGNRMRGKI